MNKEFIESCNEEIEANNYKGDWDGWHPDSKELTKEFNWHVAKLNHAILSGDIDNIKEFSCDVANFCEKAYTNAEILDDNEAGRIKSIQNNYDGYY